MFNGKLPWSNAMLVHWTWGWRRKCGESEANNIDERRRNRYLGGVGFNGVVIRWGKVKWNGCQRYKIPIIYTTGYNYGNPKQKIHIFRSKNPSRRKQQNFKIISKVVLRWRPSVFPPLEYWNRQFSSRNNWLYQGWYFFETNIKCFYKNPMNEYFVF